MKPVAVREPTSAETEVEQVVLGLLLAGSDTAWLVLDRLDVGDLLEPLHQRIVEAVRRVLNGTGEPSPLSVSAAMASDAGLEEVGGGEYLRLLAGKGAGNASIAAELCDALADQAQRRLLAHELAETESRLRDVEITASDIIAEHESAIHALAEGRPRPDDPVTWYEAGERVMARLEQPKELRSSLLPFGLAPLDNELGGMGKGDLVILAGRPSMGKTACAIAISHSVAKPKEQITFDLEEPAPPPQRAGVFMISMEMKHDALLERGLSMRAHERGQNVPYNLIRMDRIREDGHDALAKALALDAHLPFIIDHRRGQTVVQIGIRTRRAQARLRRQGVRLGLLVIDHLGLIEPERGYRGNTVAELTATTKALKTLAGSLDIPILCLCQLSRKVEDRDDKRPYLSDLRDSGSIEQDADIVLLLHREEYYLKKSQPDDSASQEKKAKWDALMERAKGKIEIHAAKVRQGAEARITMNCDLKYNWIGEAA